ncbi:hypothetical protein ACQPZJ_46385 [Actinoplanes sp. CA-054009]
MTGIEFRPGDVLEISCPFTTAEVVEVSPTHVSLRWPWWQPDPDVGWIQWNGNVAIERGPRPAGLFMTEPDTDQLDAGTQCRVGIPPTVVHVIEVQHFDPPLETGRLPRPQRELLVLRQGVAEDPEAPEQGYGFDPDDGIPRDIRLVFRPYAFLEPGDDVADAAGRAWRFDSPRDWRSYDGRGGTPVWPLTLLTGDGEAVASATATGSHAEEIAGPPEGPRR